MQHIVPERHRIEVLHATIYVTRQIGQRNVQFLDHGRGKFPIYVKNCWNFALNRIRQRMRYIDCALVEQKA